MVRSFFVGNFILYNFSAVYLHAICNRSHGMLDESTWSKKTATDHFYFHRLTFIHNNILLNEEKVGSVDIYIFSVKTRIIDFDSISESSRCM